MTAEQNPWGKLSALWNLLPPPLRPHAEDVQLLRTGLQHWTSAAAPASSRPQALILGVTPEYWSLLQSLGADTYALDISPDMIGAVWPGPRSHAVDGNWLEMPFADGTFDWIVCDGGLACLPHPHGQRRVLDETARLLRPGGLCSFRLFTPAPGEQRLEDLEGLLRAGHIRNSSELKIWLWSVLQPSPTQGIRLRQVWEAIMQVMPNLETMLRELDWPEHAFDGLRAYATSTHAYYLIDQQQARAMFAAEERGLEVLSIQRPTYPLGERCPSVLARKR